MVLHQYYQQRSEDKVAYSCYVGAVLAARIFPTQKIFDGGALGYHVSFIWIEKRKWRMFSLDAAKVSITIERLTERIRHRFPDSSLLEVCSQLEKICEKAAERTAWIERPIAWIRPVAVLCVLLVIGVGVAVPIFLGLRNQTLSVADYIQVSEAGMNDVVLIGALLFFLFTLERRIKRHRALKAIHELRSMAHVIDMHQLTKDPDRVMSTFYVPTDFSPAMPLDRFQLRRYLDYCSEMLSLTGKLAALYVQNFDDDVALRAVNEVESLTTGLSRKIWQKIMILYAPDEEPPTEFGS